MGRRLFTATFGLDLSHSFCVILSCANWYDLNIAENNYDYTEQGELFELITKKSLEYQLPGWVIHQTGWARNNTAKIADVAQTLVDKLGESLGDLSRWVDPKANEAGLDLLCYRPFADGRIGVPVYLMQCASGKHWSKKLHTPDLKVWTKVIDFAAEPRKAFATPFAFEDTLFIRTCNLVDGLLIDRYRILIDKEEDEWLSGEIKERVENWLEPRIRDLLAISD